MVEHQELWDAIAETNQRLGQRISHLAESMRLFGEACQTMNSRIANLEALQWTEEDIDKLVGSGLLGHQQEASDGDGSA